MIKLNIQADTPELQRIKDYLQDNVSETLADKINNGTPFTKDDKTLINRKDLKGFMRYASEEARKVAEKGAQYACIEDKTVFGWAIHYFEEDSIEGTLYNQDGSQYKPQRAKAVSTRTPSVIQPKPQPKREMTLFDFVVNAGETESEKNNSNDKSANEDLTKEQEAKIETETKPVEEVVQPPKPTCSPLYERYLDVQRKYPNSIIAYRVGDFYEVYGDNAAEIANFLELTLTGRDFGLEKRVAMCGLPYHASETYFDKISQKYSIAVVEISGVVWQVEKQVVERIDYETGEVLTQAEVCENTEGFDSQALNKLYEILGNIFIVRRIR